MRYLIFAVIGAALLGYVLAGAGVAVTIGG